MTFRDAVEFQWFRLKSFYWVGYDWSMDKRVRRHMRKELERSLMTENEEHYIKLGRKVLQLTIDAHPLEGKLLKPALKSDSACAKVGRDYEEKVKASDNMKLHEEYDMIVANLA